MGFKPPVAVCDACVLYPFHLRNIVVQLSVDRVFDARWTDEIHDEWMRNLHINAPTLPLERLQMTRRLMDSALPDACVRGYEPHVSMIDLPDLNDRHVVAAALHANASAIITWNLRDFPAAALEKYGLAGKSPDAFFVELYAAAPSLVVASLANARRNLTQSRVSAADFLEILSDQGLVQLVRAIRKNSPKLKL